MNNGQDEGQSDHVSPGSIIVKPQVLQLRKDVIAFRHAIFLKQIHRCAGLQKG
jgi:hypothetical protein